MAEKRPDRRVLKTKKAIRNALASLLAEKNINNITIKDIADTADINRKTFYNYYSGVYQVIDEIENEIVGDFMVLTDNMDVDELFANPYILMKHLHTIINSNLEFYSHLMSIDNNLSLIKKIVRLLKEEFKGSVRTKINVPEEHLDIILDYAITGVISAYQNWFNSDRKMPLEAVSEDVALLTLNGFNGFKNQYRK